MYNIYLGLLAVVIMLLKLDTRVESVLFTKNVNPLNIVQLFGNVPLWERFGSSIPSSKDFGLYNNASIWSKYKTDFEWWEAEISFKVSRGGQNGADGLAFWYLETKNDSITESPDLSKGLGIFFDSFLENDIHHISAVINDGGIQQKNSESDGNAQKVAGCIKKDYRDKPLLLKAKVQLYKDILTVYLNNKLSKEDEEEEYELCFQAHNPNFTKYGYFGASTASGNLAGYYSVTEAFGPHVEL